MSVHDGRSGAPWIVVFDGNCVFCTRSALFIARRDNRERFRFAASQTETGRRLLRDAGLPEEGAKSIVVIADGRAFVRSSAVLKIVSGLRTPWNWLTVGRLIPRPVRDWLYDRVASVRLKLMGQQTGCAVKNPLLESRMLR